MASFPGGYPGYAMGPQHGSGGSHAHGPHCGPYNAPGGNGASYVPHEHGHQHMHQANQGTPAPHVWTQGTPSAPLPPPRARKYMIDAALVLPSLT